jgi:vacuolar-type H+-ATPase subunit H
MKKEEKIDELREKAKNHIAYAIKKLREIPKDSDEYEQFEIDDCIRSLEDIMVLRL